MIQRLRPHHQPTRRLLAGAGLLAGWLVAAPGGAQPSLRLEAGGGTVLSDYQRSVLGYRSAAQGTARLGWPMVGPLAVQVSAGYWRFPSDRVGGYAAMATAGPRLESRAGRVGRLVVDGNAGIVRTGPDLRFWADTGAAVEIEVSPRVAVGPVVRLGWVAQPDGATNASDAIFWSTGVAASFRLTSPDPPSRPRPPGPDDDGDGIPDQDDACPGEAGVVSADPRRHGCRPDRDSDGILDADDRCPDEAETYNTVDDDDGCPEALPGALAAVSGERVLLAWPLVFDPSGSLVEDSSNRLLFAALASLLAHHPELPRVEIQGYRGRPGSAADEQATAYEQASAVRRELVRRGVAPERLVAVGWRGPLRPAPQESRGQIEIRLRRRERAAKEDR